MVTMSKNGILSTHDGNGTHPEELLNVLRESDKLVLGTSEIADTVGLSDTAARDYLNDLRDDDRLIKQDVGGVDVWGLPRTEIQNPIPPELDRLARFNKEMRDFFEATQFVGVGFMVFGAMIIMTGLADPVTSALSTQLTDVALIVIGAGIAASGGATWFLGGGLVLVTKTLESASKLRNNDRGSVNLGEAGIGDSRGQGKISVVGSVLVLVMLFPTLVQVGGSLFTAFAGSSLFSQGMALLISITLILAIVFAILGK